MSEKRMETVDDETSDRAIAFIKEQQAAGKPWFVWWNGTRMHFRTHVKPELRGIAENTIVFYSTDNAPHMNTWPDAGWNPFRVWQQPFVPMRIPFVYNRLPYGVSATRILRHSNSSAIPWG